MNTPEIYPLKFHPIYKTKVWGGRTLEKIGRTLPGDPTQKVGESWEIADIAQTSVSGGGGGAERSIVSNGPLANRTLHDVMELLGYRLMGDAQLTPEGGFPLLIKFLDARENLSVQVHPSPAYASAHPGAPLKSEAWYILDADPGAAIYKGIHAGVTPKAFRTAIEASLRPDPDTKTIESMMIRVPVKTGDCHYLPSGTCHAMGAGILAAEVQTPSDTTFRVYDWGRKGRELHVEQALECIDFGPPNVSAYEKRTHISGIHTSVSRVCACDFFRIEKIRMSEGYEQELPYNQPAIWMVLEGRGAIALPGRGRAVSAVPFRKGETLLIPAGMMDARVSMQMDTSWLEVTFPRKSPVQMA